MRDTKNTKKSIFSHIFDGIKSIFTNIKNVFFKKENGKEKQSLKKQKEQAIEITSEKETINITGYSAYTFVDKSAGGEEKKSTIWNLPSVPVEDFAKKYCAYYSGGEEIAKKNCFSIFRRSKTEDNFQTQLKNAVSNAEKIIIISTISKQAQNEKLTAPNRAAFFKTISKYIKVLYWAETSAEKAISDCYYQKNQQTEEHGSRSLITHNQNQERNALQKKFFKEAKEISNGQPATTPPTPVTAPPSPIPASASSTSPLNK